MLVTDIITDKKFISVKEDKKTNIKTYHSPYLDYHYEYDTVRKRLYKSTYSLFENNIEKYYFDDELFLIFLMKCRSFMSKKFRMENNTSTYMDTSIKNIRMRGSIDNRQILIKNHSRKNSLNINLINMVVKLYFNGSPNSHLVDNSTILETHLKKLI